LLLWFRDALATTLAAVVLVVVKIVSAMLAPVIATRLRS
jgi:hypothetical protein